MPEAVVDTGPFIHLNEINLLEIFTAVFSNLHIPEQVVREISNNPILDFIRLNSEHITVHPVPEPELFATKDAYSSFKLQLADLAVLTLITKITEALAVTDDLALRRAVESSDRDVIGTVGILFRAHKTNSISADQLRGAINSLFNDSTLYLSSAFKAKILSLITS